MRPDPRRHEAVELLAPNAAAFGVDDSSLIDVDGATDEGFDDEPRSKWSAVAASLVVLALLAGGVIAAEPWTDDATPATTTTDPAGFDEPFELAAAGTPSLVVDPPGGFEVAAAWGTDPRGEPADLTDHDWFGLWATPGATRTSGRWLAISTVRARGDYYETRPGATRIDIARDYGVLSTSDDGVTRLIFTANDRTPIEIGGFGISMAELRSIAEELETAQRSLWLFYGPATARVIRDMDPLIQTPVPSGGLDLLDRLSSATSGVVYAGPTAGSRFSVEVRQPSEADDVLWTFLARPLDRMSMADNAALTELAAGRPQWTVAADPDLPGDLAVRWTTDQGVVTVASSGLSLTTLLDALRTARVPGQTEWAQLVGRSSDGQVTLAGSGSAGASPRVLVGRTAPGSIDPGWRIEMSDAPMSAFLSAGASGWSGPLGDVTSEPTVRRYASMTLTYLVATAGRESTARRIRVTVDGRDPIDVPMVDVGPSVRAAGFAYATIADARVEFLDDAGNLVG